MYIPFKNANIDTEVLIENLVDCLKEGVILRRIFEVNRKHESVEYWDMVNHSEDILGLIFDIGTRGKHEFTPIQRQLIGPKLSVVLPSIDQYLWSQLAITWGELPAHHYPFLFSAVQFIIEDYLDLPKIGETTVKDTYEELPMQHVAIDFERTFEDCDLCQVIKGTSFELRDTVPKSHNWWYRGCLNTDPEDPSSYSIKYFGYLC